MANQMYICIKCPICEEMFPVSGNIRTVIFESRSVLTYRCPKCKHTIDGNKQLDEYRRIMSMNGKEIAEFITNFPKICTNAKWIGKKSHPRLAVEKCNGEIFQVVFTNMDCMRYWALGVSFAYRKW